MDNVLTQLKSDLCRLARFGANITDAHSCLIFLPHRLFRSYLTDRENLIELKTTGKGAEVADHLELGGFHSLGNAILKGCRIEISSGLVGWVAKHKRTIHVSPFDHDSRTLGFYNDEQGLKSFIGVPIALDEVESYKGSLAGAIVCDSKKSFAFSKLQGKLLHDLSFEVSNLLKLTALNNSSFKQDNSWQSFISKAHALAESLTPHAVEVLRLRPLNFHELEHSLGTGKALRMADQIFRLIAQALPPHSPVTRLPNGDIIVVMDNMLTASFENKVRAMANHLSIEGGQLQIQFIRKNFRENRSRSFDLMRLISESCEISTLTQQRIAL